SFYSNITKVTSSSAATLHIVWLLRHSKHPLLVAAAVVAAVADPYLSCDTDNCSMDHCRLSYVTRQHCCHHLPCRCHQYSFLDRRYDSAGTQCILDVDE